MYFTPSSLVTLISVSSVPVPTPAISVNGELKIFIVKQLCQK